MKKLSLYYYTLKDLKLVQVVHQIIYKCKKRFEVARFISRNSLPKHNENFKLFILELDFDKGYLSRFNLEDLITQKINILHEAHFLHSEEWEIEEASHLWNYNLQYLEFLIPLAIKYKITHDIMWYQLWKEYLESWIEHPVVDCFESYTISMLIPNILICIEIFKEELQKDNYFWQKISSNLYAQYRYLWNNMEYRLLANHFFENIKAVIISALYFEEQNIYKKALKKLYLELQEQILEDGLHYELSFMYHHIVLEGLLRVVKAMLSCEKEDDAESLRGIIIKMAESMCSLEKGIGRIPLFNDSGNNVAKSLQALKSTVEEIYQCRLRDDYTVFYKSGYGKIYNGNAALIFDSGSLGPKYMSGHSHCDCLSFELFIDKKPLFVNSGTYLYQGKERSYFRSSKAHNTIMIDSREQAELWGEHRCAKKTHDFSLEKLKNGLRGKFSSFCGDRFERTITIEDSIFKIYDKVKACDKKKHDLKLFFHIAPVYTFFRFTHLKLGIKNRITEEIVARMEFSPDVDITVHDRTGELCMYAEDFGEKYQIETLEIKKKFVNETTELVKIIIEER